ncbi:MAG: acyl-CoA dehydrogenase family protein [Ilumatobacteraceae bacterium]
MDLTPAAEVVELRSTFARLLDNVSSPERVRAAEPLGFDADLWRRFLSIGVPTLGVSEDLGGHGANLLALCDIAEVCGRHLAAAPFVESIVASRLVASRGVASDSIDRALLTLALRPVVDGTARLVPAGAVAQGIAVLDDDELALLDVEPSMTAIANLGSMPLADVSVRRTTGRRVLASGPEAYGAFETAKTEWRVLTAASLVGLADGAMQLGVEYAKSRHQFGVPIGSFQAVSQPFADHATAVEGARLLALRAAWAADRNDPTSRSLASMAFIFAARTAQRAAAHALHVHGGYGFMLEYDVQLFFRRAKAWPAVIGDLPGEVDCLATVMFGPAAGAA